MAATKRQMNWVSVGFTPSGGSVSTATGVTSVSVKTGGSLVKFSGDGDRGPTTVVNDFNEPMIEVSCADLPWLMSLVPGINGALAATHSDAKLASGGAIVYALSPCIIEAPSNQGDHRQIGRGTVNFVGWFSDGQTNPLSFSRV